MTTAEKCCLAIYRLRDSALSMSGPNDGAPNVQRVVEDALDLAETWSGFEPAEYLREAVEARLRPGDPPFTVHRAPDGSVLIVSHDWRGNPRFRVATEEELLKCQ